MDNTRECTDVVNGDKVKTESELFGCDHEVEKDVDHRDAGAVSACPEAVDLRNERDQTEHDEETILVVSHSWQAFLISNTHILVNMLIRDMKVNVQNR